MTSLPFYIKLITFGKQLCKSLEQLPITKLKTKSKLSIVDIYVFRPLDWIFQVNYEEVKQINNGVNPCSTESRDSCFETSLKIKLLTHVGCAPPWIDLNGLQYCNTPKAIMKADDVLQDIVANFDSMCLSPCHYLEITSGSRNFQRLDNPEIKSYLYFPYKVQHRLDGFIEQFLQEESNPFLQR